MAAHIYRVKITHRLLAIFLSCSLFLCFGALSMVSSAGAAEVSFERVHVYAEHRVYDPLYWSFPDTYLIKFGADLTGSCNPHPVRVQWDAGEAVLTYWPTYSHPAEGYYDFGTGSWDPVPGSEWEEKTYTFTLDCFPDVSETVFIPAGTFYSIGVPDSVVVTNGNVPSVTWSPVRGADVYRVRLFELKSSGSPDTIAILYDSGSLTTLSHDLALDNVPPGCYCLGIEARDLEGDRIIARSRYFTRIFVGECNDLEFTQANVYSEHRVYDSCFTNTETCFMKIGAALSGICNPHPVRVVWDGGSEVLTPWPDWSCCSYEGQYVFSKNFGALGSEWEDKTYNFSVDCAPGVTDSVAIPPETFYCLDVPGNVVVTNGLVPSVSWSTVPEADQYKVRLYPLNNYGNPDTAILLYDSGPLPLTTLSHTLSGLGELQPGMYCLSVEAQDMSGERLINRARYYTSISIGDCSSVAFAGIHVYTDHRVYGSCFTYSQPENYFMIISAVISSDDYNPHPVRVQWSGQEYVINPLIGWHNCCKYEGQYVFGKGFYSPLPGHDWEDTTYTFTVDCNENLVSTLTIPSGTFHQLDIPSEINVTNGIIPSVSWSAVAGADSYEVRLFPLDDSGNPDAAILVYDSGRIFSTSHVLLNPENISPGCYALRIESREYLGDSLVNRSRYYTKILINCPSTHPVIDFNLDKIHDIALFYPANHKWYIKDQISPTYGTADCLPIPGDYDGDGTTDLAVVDLTRGDNRAKWYLDGVGVFIYGLQEWIPVSGDYNGDGITDAALFNPDTGKWYIRNQFVTTYGAGGIPVPGDYNGDNITDIAVFNLANNKWYIKDIGIFTYGMADCIPVPADYDGDGITDLAVIDTSRPDGMAKWYIRNQAVFIYGAVDNTIPVPGDYDGDGDADPCLFYQNTGKWYCRNVGVWSYGNGDMIPLAGNLANRYAISEAEGGGAVW